MRPPLSAIEPCRLAVAIGTRGEAAERGGAGDRARRRHGGAA